MRKIHDITHENLHELHAYVVVEQIEEKKFDKVRFTNQPPRRGL